MITIFSLEKKLYFILCQRQASYKDIGLYKCFVHHYIIKNVAHITNKGLTNKTLKVSLITLTNRAYSVIYFNTIIQMCYVQYQSNNVSDS